MGPPGDKRNYPGIVCTYELKKKVNIYVIHTLPKKSNYILVSLYTMSGVRKCWADEGFLWDFHFLFSSSGIIQNVH
jgi:hypothetical protein